MDELRHGHLGSATPQRGHRAFASVSTRPTSLLPTPHSCQAFDQVQGHRRRRPELCSPRNVQRDAAPPLPAASLGDGCVPQVRPWMCRGDGEQCSAVTMPLAAYRKRVVPLPRPRPGPRQPRARSVTTAAVDFDGRPRIRAEHVSRGARIPRCWPASESRTELR